MRTNGIWSLIVECYNHTLITQITRETLLSTLVNVLSFVSLINLGIQRTSLYHVTDHVCIM